MDAAAGVASDRAKPGTWTPCLDHFRVRTLMDRLTLILILLIPTAFICGARLGATWTRLGDVLAARNVRSHAAESIDQDAFPEMPGEPSGSSRAGRTSPTGWTAY